MVLLGNPFVGNVIKPLSNDELVQAIRVDITGEYEAIIGYEAHSMATNDERVKKVLQNIANEERKHVGQLEQLVALLNPQEAQSIEQGRQVIRDQQAQNFQQPLQ
jgi:rubrerythrin